MISLVISNQKGGVAKTTTTHTLGRFLADRGYRVLMVDIDPQGSLGMVIGAQPQYYLNHFVMMNFRLSDCVWRCSPNLHLLASNRDTAQAELSLAGRIGREMSFQTIFAQIEDDYDVILFDAAPSISLLWTCALVYAQRMLLPLTMDPMSWAGVLASLETAKALNGVFKLNIRPVAFLPVIFDKRLQMTDVIMKSMTHLSEVTSVPILPAVRLDASTSKANRQRKFLIDYDPNCRVVEDYAAAFESLMEVLKDGLNVGATQLPL